MSIVSGGEQKNGAQAESSDHQEAEFFKQLSMLTPLERARLVRTMLENLQRKNISGVANSA